MGVCIKRSNTGKERKDDEANRIQEFINNQSDPESIYITDGNVINSKKYIFIRDKDLVDGKLPFKFGRVDKDFYCSECTSLTSLDGVPQKVGGTFDCQGCTSLTSLEGTPQEVGFDFNCRNCPSLTSLEGAPQEVGRNFDCSKCTQLETLKGVPTYVSGNFNCSDCVSLESLEYIPEHVSDMVICGGCKGKFKFEDVKNICDVKEKNFKSDDIL